MNVRQAHEYLGTLIRAGLGELDMYTEFDKVTGMQAGGAEHARDGMQLEMDESDPFVYVRTEH